MVATAHLGALGGSLESGIRFGRRAATAECGLLSGVLKFSCFLVSCFRRSRNVAFGAFSWASDLVYKPSILLGFFLD